MFCDRETSDSWFTSWTSTSTSSSASWSWTSAAHMWDTRGWVYTLVVLCVGWQTFQISIIECCENYQHDCTRVRAAECVTECSRGGNSTNYCACVEFMSLLPPSMNHCCVLHPLALVHACLMSLTSEAVRWDDERGCWRDANLSNAVCPPACLSVQAVLFDIITKNYDKIKKPRGDGKALIYWDDQQDTSGILWQHPGSLALRLQNKATWFL